MATPFIAQITMFGGNFAPRGWAFCDGQILSISQNTALFSLLGTTYGGNGQTTFALPDLRGRTPIGPRQGAGLSNYNLGQKGGTETVTLNQTELPAHTHQVTARASTNEATDTEPTNNFLATGNQYTSSSNTDLNANAVQAANTGGNQPHENRQPFLAINYIIALQGIFPSRN